MEIQGLQKMTLLDYPGKVACTVFLGGCDLRCPFCHNGELVEGEAPAALNDGELTAFLKNGRACWMGCASPEESPCSDRSWRGC